MSSPTTTHFSNTAYYKAIFHAAKFPQYCVNGVFTGHISNNVYYITDAYPLSHTQITLIPLLEAALMQIETILSMKRNDSGVAKEQVIGYYFANEHVDDERISPFHQSVASKIDSALQGDRAIVFMIDNYRLEPQQVGSHFAMKHFASDNGKSWKMSEDKKSHTIVWTQQKQTNVMETVIFEELRRHLDNGAFHKLVDFEQHVDHLSYDYTNPDIF